jgi:hypothetical protein
MELIDFIRVSEGIRTPDPWGHNLAPGFPGFSGVSVMPCPVRKNWLDCFTVFSGLSGFFGGFG